MSGTVGLTGTCGGRAASLTVSWVAARTDVPEAPTAGFSLGPDPVSLTADGGVVTFGDTSVDDVDGGTIVSRVWEFGDPASGDANAAEGAEVSHRYTTTGTFTVRLTVTDDDGLSVTVADLVSVEP
jgi:PKD repeat protein